MPVFGRKESCKRNCRELRSLWSWKSRLWFTEFRAVLLTGQPWVIVAIKTRYKSWSSRSYFVAGQKTSTLSLMARRRKRFVRRAIPRRQDWQRIKFRPGTCRYLHNFRRRFDTREYVVQANEPKRREYVETQRKVVIWRVLFFQICFTIVCAFFVIDNNNYESIIRF